MNHLKDDIQSMISHVSSLQANPTPQQLENKILLLSKALLRDAISLPKKVNETILHCFESIGWNAKTNTVFKACFLTTENLILCLKLFFELKILKFLKILR
jgi:hypothetical protein